jgi:addiction module HigA family antidote
MLAEEFLEPRRISQTAFAAKLKIPLNRVNEIVKGKRGITAETAWLFAAALGTSPEFWMNLQANHDLAKARPAGGAHPRAFRLKPMDNVRRQLAVDPQKRAASRKRA